MTKRKSALYVLSLFAFVFLNAGCKEQTLDPAQIGRFRPVPVVNVILDSLGVEDEPAPTYAGAEDPKPSDVIDLEQDYVFGVGDTIRISIFELIQQGTNYVSDYIVTESGRISIPEVGQIRAAGLTETKLEDEIEDILSPNILLDPFVKVTLQETQSQMASISGQGVGRSLRIPIPRYDFRLTDFIAVAGGIEEFNVSNIYVSRKVTGNESVSADISNNTPKSQLNRPEKGFSSSTSREDEILSILEPYESGNVTDHVVIASSGMGDPADMLIDADSGYSQAQEPNGRIEWVFEDGKWAPLRVGGSSVTHTQPVGLDNSFAIEEKSDETEYGWDQIGTGGKQIRVIKIPVDKLLGGDPKYNIIVRPGDSITVPVDIIGEFYVSGNVNRSGPINLTGRPMTLKMAISAAGGLGQMAWPKKVEVVRRIGRNKEEIVMVDLDKIAKGIQPDFFIKPNDLINVGTHIVSQYLFELRRAFFASYGFSFQYSKNFSNQDFNGAVVDFIDLF